MKKEGLMTKVLVVIGVLLLLSGAGLGYYYYQNTYGTSEQDKALQQDAEKVESQWEEKPKEQPKEPTSYEEGDTVGILKIPAWGDWKVPIIESTSDESLELGVGRYSESARPGQPGNLAIAGHRSGDPQPFRELLDLEVGDEVIVETEIAIYTYKVTSPATETTVRAQDGAWVIRAPQVDSEAEHTITLTTCTYLYRSDDRSVLFGELVDKEYKQ